MQYADVTYFEKKYDVPLSYLKNGTIVCIEVEDDKSGEMIEHYGCFIGLPNFSTLPLVEYCSGPNATCYTEHLFNCHSDKEKLQTATKYYPRDKVINIWEVTENRKTICIYVPTNK